VRVQQGLLGQLLQELELLQVSQQQEQQERQQQELEQQEQRLLLFLPQADKAAAAMMAAKTRDLFMMIFLIGVKTISARLLSTP